MDGKKVTELSAGTYEFVSQSEVDKLLEQQVSGFNIPSIWRAIVQFFKGKKVNEQLNEKRPLNELKTMDDVIRQLRADSHIVVYLKQDRAFPLIISTKDDAHREFAPMRIKTKYVDADFGVSLFVQINDFEQFIRYYLVDNDTVSTNDIQNSLKLYLPSILQEELRDVEIDAYGLPAPVRDKILLRIKALESLLHGLSIVNVVDISCAQRDLERFRMLAQEMYLSEKELDYLKRTNEFKNRLIEVKNEQKLKEAAGTVSLLQAVRAINHDRLLNDEEERSFMMQLETQRKIREAKNEQELTVALNEIARDRLMSEDQLENWKQDMAASNDRKKFDRENVTEILRMQGLALRDKKALELDAEVMRSKIQLDSSLDSERIAAARKKMEEEIDYNIERQRRSLELIEFSNRNALAEAEGKNALLAKEIEQHKLVDDYEFGKRSREDQYEDGRFDENIRRTRATNAVEIDYVRDKNDVEIDRISKLSAISMGNLKAMHDMDAEDESRRNEHEMALKKAEMEERMHKDNLAHDETMTKLLNEFNINMARAENEKGFTTEQILANRIDQMDPEARKAFMEALSSHKELKAVEEARYLIDRERALADAKKEEIWKMAMASKDKSSEDFKEFAKYAMGLNASVAAGAVDRQRESEQQNYDRYERIATHRADEQADNMQKRMDDIDDRKEEYRQQMMHEQGRIDKNQDMALNYVTRHKPDKPTVSNDISLLQKECPHCHKMVHVVGPRCPQCGEFLE